MSFTTVETVALHLNRDHNDLTAQELSQISLLIEEVDGVIANYCGWELLATDYTDKRYSGDGTGYMDLRIYPVNTLVQVRERTSDGSFLDITTDIEVLDDGVLAFLPTATTTTFTSGKNNYFISFSGGFQEGEIPNSIVFAATNLVVENFRRIVDENYGSKEEGFENIKFVNFDDEISKLTARTLDRYRIVSIF